VTSEGKVAVITGASQGIGAALVKAHCGRGCRVVATSRSIGPSGDGDVISDVIGAALYREATPFATGEILHADGGRGAGH
jgi:NAD(P)-dependent dehydrogenase (short-subunit alcohol dehydrogenase family)